MGTEKEFDALASEAIASSEKEFFDEAMGAPEPDADESGDRSLEEMGNGLEGQHEPGDEKAEEGKGDEAQTEAKAEGEETEAKASDRDDQGRFKPKGQEQQPGKVETPAERGLRNEVTGERAKRQAVETEFANYRAENDKRWAAFEARQAQPAPAQQPQPQPEQPKDEAPDRWTDPDGYDRWREAQIVKQFETRIQQQEQRRVAASFKEAETKHGDAFVEAYRAAEALPANDPAAKQMLDAVMSSFNPAERLMEWHRQQKAAREIGNDPAAFRAKLEAETREALMKDPEFRKQILGELQTEARAGDGSPRSLTKLPPSLSSARGGSLSRAGSGGTSDTELFEDAMS